jgi:hypothetical protein
MTATLLTGFTVNTTEKSIAFVATDAARIDAKPFHIPMKKIDSIVELDEIGVDIQVKGESIQRKATPVTVMVHTAFLERLGLA